jgi:hypothetical protein
MRYRVGSPHYGDRTRLPEAPERDLSMNIFTVVPDEVLRSTSLSFGAKGVYALLASQDDRHVTLDWLTRQGPDGRNAARSRVNELIEAGFVVLRQERDRGRFQYWYELVRQPRQTNAA